MSTVILIIFVLTLSVVVPVLALYWVANGRTRNRLHLLLKTVAAAVVIVTLYLGNPWSFIGYYFRYVYVVLFVVAVGFAWWASREQPWLSRIRGRAWAAVAGAVVVTALFGMLLVDSLAAGRMPDGAVEVEFPFQEGTFHMAQAGSSPGMNAHLAARDHPRFRGQTWALDITRLYPLGTRARGLYPRDPASYRIFGTPVHAPCGGTVAAAVNDLPDLDPPQTDRENLAGNHVLLACDEGFFILLAHLEHGSVEVEQGDAVSTGARLGAVGNSGNTSEPHLHIHAQAAEGEDHLLDADPVPIVFREHGWLKRNDLVRVGD